MGATLYMLGELAPAPLLEQGIALYDPSSTAYVMLYGQDEGRLASLMHVWAMCNWYPDQALSGSQEASGWVELSQPFIGLCHGVCCRSPSVSRKGRSPGASRGSHDPLARAGVAAWPGPGEMLRGWALASASELLREGKEMPRIRQG